MRRVSVYALSLTAAGLVALAMPPLAVADDATPVVISVPSPAAGHISLDTHYAGLDETNVTVGVETAGVPCGNCVRQAGTPNIGLPWPVFTVPQDTMMTVSTWFESTTYNGPCTAGVILKQGNTVVYTGSYAFQGGCQAGYLYGVNFDVPAPATTGFTTVIGTVSGGTNKSGADTFINVTQ